MANMRAVKAAMMQRMAALFAANASGEGRRLLLDEADNTETAVTESTSTTEPAVESTTEPSENETAKVDNESSTTTDAPETVTEPASD